MVDKSRCLSASNVKLYSRGQGGGGAFCPKQEMLPKADNILAEPHVYLSCSTRWFLKIVAQLTAKKTKDIIKIIARSWSDGTFRVLLTPDSFLMLMNSLSVGENK